MRRWGTLGVALLVALCCLSRPCGAQDEGGPQVARDTPVPGVEHIYERIGRFVWSIHVVKIDREREDLRLVLALAQGRACGVAPVSEIVAQTPVAEGETPVAAINGGFFEMPPKAAAGVPLGLYIAGGELVSAPLGGFTCAWWERDGSLRMGRVNSALHVVWPDGETRTAIGLNEVRPAGAAVLYTPTFGLAPNKEFSPAPTTRTIGGRELVLERAADGPWLPLALGSTCPARVREVRQEGGTPLQEGVMILSLGPDLTPTAPVAQPGDVLTLAIRTDPDLSGVQTAACGGVALVKDGKVRNLTGRGRHPRAAFGWNDTHLFFLVVDGRQLGLSVGMTHAELAQLAGRHGCTQALELDGGGSATMWVGGQVVNSPSDGQERPVGTALILLRQAPPEEE